MPCRSVPASGSVSASPPRISPDASFRGDGRARQPEAALARCRSRRAARVARRADGIANAYFEGVQRNDGKGYYPFTDDCDRIENGAHTTNTPSGPTTPGGFNYMALDCKKQLESGYLAIVTSVYIIAAFRWSTKSAASSGRTAVFDLGRYRAQHQAYERRDGRHGRLRGPRVEHRSQRGVQDRARQDPPRRDDRRQRAVSPELAGADSAAADDGSQASRFRFRKLVSVRLAQGASPSRSRPSRTRRRYQRRPLRESRSPRVCKA